MWPAVPTTRVRGAFMDRGSGGEAGRERAVVLLAHPLDLLHLVFVVLAEEEVPLCAAFREVAALRQDLAPNRFLDLVLPRHLAFQDLQDLEPDVVGVVQEFHLIVVLERIDDQMREMDAALVAEAHQMTIFRSRAILAFTLRNSSW